MLPLAGPQFPGSLDELLVALRTGFGTRGVTIREIQAHGEWPRVSQLSVDLTDAQLSRATRMEKEAAAAPPGLHIGNLSISATPLFFENTPIHLELRASKAECGFARHSAGEPLLQVLRVEDGSVMVEARRADLEIALKNFAHSFLAKQGADVKSARLDLTDRGPGSLSFRAEITAKAFLMTARVAVTGQIELDDQLNLRIRDLATSGDGMLAGIAGGFLRPRFAEIEKRTIPLAAHSFAGVTLHDVRLSGGNALRVEARFSA